MHCRVNQADEGQLATKLFQFARRGERVETARRETGEPQRAFGLAFVDELRVVARHRGERSAFAAFVRVSARLQAVDRQRRGQNFHEVVEVRDDAARRVEHEQRRLRTFGAQGNQTFRQRAVFVHRFCVGRRRSGLGRGRLRIRPAGHQFQHDFRKLGDVAARREFARRQRNSKRLLDTIQQFKRHQRVETHLLERSLNFEFRGTRPQHTRDNIADVLHHERGAFAGRCGQNRVAQFCAAARRVATGRLDQFFKTRRNIFPAAELRAHRPVHAHEAELRGVRLREPTEHRPGLRGRDARDAAGREMSHDFLVARREAHIGNRAPVHRQRSQPACPAILRQRVHETVRGGIIALPRRTDERRDGREQHEEIQRQLFGGAMQMPSADDFWRHHARETFRRLLHQRAVVQHRRRVQHAAQRRAIFTDETENFLHVGLARHVHLHDEHFRAELLQFLHAAFRVRRGSAAAPGQHELFRAGLHHEFGERETETTEATGHQVAGVRRKILQLFTERTLRLNFFAVHRDDNFADVFRR